MTRVSLERFCQELSSACSQVCEEEIMKAEKSDDDPADTAAITWLRTPPGKAALEHVAEMPGAQLRCAFRAGYLIGRRAEREERR